MLRLQKSGPKDTNSPPGVIWVLRLLMILKLITGRLQTTLQRGYHRGQSEILIQ